MAVISRIRKHSGWLVALIGISIAGFILQDAFSGRNQGGRAPKFAVINGEEIKIQEFEQKVEMMSENFRRASGEVSLSNEDMHQIRERVWMTMVNDVLLYKACKKLGLSVTTKELNDMYYGQFIHNLVYRTFANPETGEINRQQVMMTINNFDQYTPEQQIELRDLEIAVKDDRLKTKYYNIVATAYYVPSFYAKFVYEQDNSSASMEVASMSYVDVADDEVSLSDADYKAYYNENKALFHRTETSRAVDFVVFDVLPTTADLQELEETANDLYADFLVEENLPDFVRAVSTERFDSVYIRRDALQSPWDSVLFRAPKGTYFKPEIYRNRYEMAKLIDVASRPDSLRASHILIAYQGAMRSQQVRTKEEAQRMADSLRNVLLRDRSQYAMIAQASSDDPATKDNAGDLNWFPDNGMMAKEIVDAIIRGNVGDIVVVETVFGFHIVQITGKTAPVQKAMVAFVYLPIEPSESTNKTVYTEANQFFAKCQDLESFTKAADEMKLSVRRAEYVREMDMQMPGLQNARDLVRWAYGEDTEPGQMAAEIYTYENQYVIATLREIREKGDPSVEELKKLPEFEYAVRNEKKAALLKEKMNNAMQSNRSLAALSTLGADIDTIDQLNFNAYGFGNKGYEPDVVGSVFGTTENTVSAPIQGRSGVFVVQPTTFTKPEAPEMIDIFKSQMTMMFQQRMLESMRVAMENGAKIKENRAFYY